MAWYDSIISSASTIVQKTLSVTSNGASQLVETLQNAGFNSDNIAEQSSILYQKVNSGLQVALKSIGKGAVITSDKIQELIGVITEKVQQNEISEETLDYLKLVTKQLIAEAINRGEVSLETLKIYSQNVIQSNKTELMNNITQVVKGTLEGAGLGSAIVAATQGVVTAIGFTSSGVAAGSLGASMMSGAAIANGGAIASGTLVAGLQTIGAAGAMSTIGAPVIGVAAVAGLTYQMIEMLKHYGVDVIKETETEIIKEEAEEEISNQSEHDQSENNKKDEK